jgi:hypothetical protein
MGFAAGTESSIEVIGFRGKYSQTGSTKVLRCASNTEVQGDAS